METFLSVAAILFSWRKGPRYIVWLLVQSFHTILQNTLKVECVSTASTQAESWGIARTTKNIVHKIVAESNFTESYYLWKRNVKNKQFYNDLFWDRLSDMSSCKDI